MVSKNGKQAEDGRRRKPGEVESQRSGRAQAQAGQQKEQEGERDTTNREERSSDHLLIDQDCDLQPVGYSPRSPRRH